MEIENIKTTSQQERSKDVSFNKFLKSVVAIVAKSPNPTIIESVKNLFLNGLDLKQDSLERAVNI